MYPVAKRVLKIKHVFESQKNMIASLGSQSLPLELDIRSSNGYRITKGEMTVMSS